MTQDSLRILSDLVRRGIWSAPSVLTKFGRVVVDADGAVDHLYGLCVSSHVHRQRALISADQSPDLYSSTLVNYAEFSLHVNQLLDFFHNQHLELALVYGGKHMEAPLFGLTAAKFKSNTQRVADRVAQLRGLERHGNLVRPHLATPSLALIVFKTIVNARRKSGAKIDTHQAFYSALPVMAKLARNLRCPVLTNRCEFILLDVRAGFMTLDLFWSQHFDGHNSLARDRARSLTSVRGRSKIRSNSSQRASSADRTGQASSDFHYHLRFVRQHPNLNQQLAANLFPLTSVDLVSKFSASLVKLRACKAEFKDGDFLSTNSQKESGKLWQKKYQRAANRLDTVIEFLGGKTVDVISNLVRGEATRTNTSFDVDYRQTFNYHMVAYDFKRRLRSILKYMDDQVQLNYVERCLTNRESTADYLLEILCCGVGRLASVSYNHRLLFEDLGCKRSALWSKNRSKSMIMSLFTANKSHQGETSISSKKPDTSTRYSTASLTVVDREKSTIVEHTVTTTHDDAQAAKLTEKLQFNLISRRQVNQSDRLQFMSYVYRSSDLTRLPEKLASSLNSVLSKDAHQTRTELAIFLSLLKFSIQEASQGEDSFQKSYAESVHHFEIAIVNHALFMHAREDKHKGLAALVDLINQRDWANVAALAIIKSSSGSRGSKKKSKSSPTSPKLASKSLPDFPKGSSKQIRHIIELLVASIEVYCEMNALFEYPLPRLSLDKHFNPILLFNLACCSQLEPNNKALLKF